MLANLAASAGLFHTASGTAYADLFVDGHRETWSIRSLRFRAWLRRRYYEEMGGAPSAEALNSALNVIEARAQFDSPEWAVQVRVAEHQGHIYLDLADQRWQAVEIGPDGWRVISCPPVRFRRPAGMLPLPVPEKGGAITALEALASFLNLAGRNDFVLVVAWLLAALRYGGPYPLLGVSGEQGSAKTILSKIVRSLVDPNIAPVRALPREDRELFITANNGHVLAFDNLSGLPSWISDTFCRLASGGGFAVRQLYSDQDEVLFEAARPIILNGIEDVITRPDLTDRAILLTLAPITDARRRPEKEFWLKFEIERPRILGALLDAAANGLRALPCVRLQRLPRMADFAHWAAACETAFWPSGTFEDAYWKNRRAAIENVIDADPVAACVREIMAERRHWAGSASDLLRAGVDARSGDVLWRSAGWPKTPRALAGRLRRAQTFLRTLGIEVVFSREGRAGTRMIRMSAAPENPPRKTVRAVSTVRDNGPRPGSRHPRRGQRVRVNRANDADGADAKAALHSAAQKTSRYRIGTPGWFDGA